MRRSVVLASDIIVSWSLVGRDCVRKLSPVSRDPEMCPMDEHSAVFPLINTYKQLT